MVQLFIYSLMDTLEFQHHTFYLGQNTWKDSQELSDMHLFHLPSSSLAAFVLPVLQKNNKYNKWRTFVLTYTSNTLVSSTYISALVQTLLLTYYDFRNVETYECVTGGLQINGYIYARCAWNKHNRTHYHHLEPCWGRELPRGELLGVK